MKINKDEFKKTLKTLDRAMALFTRGVIVCGIIVVLAPSTASADGRWSIVELSQKADTVCVSVSASIDDFGSCPPVIGCGGTDWALLRVTPCPLYVICNGDVYQKNISDGILRKTIVLALLTGVTYTFDGSWGVERFDFDIYTNQCELPLCNVTEDFTPVTYERSPLPTYARKWGAIKSMFRTDTKYDR